MKRAMRGADTLSELLRAVRLTGAVFFDVRASSPWVEETQPGPNIASRVLPGVEHVISYHAVTHGTCFAGVVDAPPVRLETGDVIVFPHGDPHVLASAPGLRARGPNPADHYARRAAEHLPRTVNTGGGGPDRTHLVCGFLGCDVRPFNPLIAALPRYIVARDRPGDEQAWLAPLVRLALSESTARRSGSEVVLARLSELLFVEVVRRYLDSLPEGQTGWLAGLRDPCVGRALSLLHGQPARAWSLAALAHGAGLSRSALAERFTDLVGVPPMQYLLRWRLQLAAGLLAEGGKVSAVALEVGYDSEAAFSRAFKRIVGQPPASWRDRQVRTAHAESARRADPRWIAESAPDAPVSVTMR
jgi:AraC-like DNA-binding protein